MKKRLVVTILSFALVLGNILYPTEVLAVSGAGAGLIVKPMFTNINVFINSFHIFEDGRACVSSYLEIRDADMAAISVYLERYSNGTWSEVHSWSNSSYTFYTTVDGAYYVPSGYSYRMRSHGFAYKNGSIVEMTSYYSSSEYY